MNNDKISSQNLANVTPNVTMKLMIIPDVNAKYQNHTRCSPLLNLHLHESNVPSIRSS
jgi:hypothetical protein